MFYCQSLLSKKGPLGTIWVAAHCFKRLKKHQVALTNLSSSVDTILLYEVPVVTYRVLGHLLLGVVRIYSKKVEYLFHDCRHVLVKLNDFVSSKKFSVHIKTICAPYLSITRPDRFELDAFDLQISEDGSSVHVRPDEDIILKDAWKNEGTGQYAFDKYYSEETSAYIETCSAVSTPFKDVLSPQFMENYMVASTSHNLSNSEVSIEKLRDNYFSLEERLDPMTLGDFEEEPGLVRSFGEKHQNDGEQIKFLDTEKVIEAEEAISEEEHSEPVRSFDEEQYINAEQMKFLEMTSPESRKCQITTGCPSITIDVTPEPKCLNSPGATTPEFMAVQTPATKECARISRKRKCLFDDIIVLPNKVLKESIDDSRNLVSKRKKAPHTPFHVRKACQIFNLPHSLLEPLIPCIPLELRSLFYRKGMMSPEAVEMVEAPEKLDILGSPTIHRFPDETDIAPSTPVTHSTSLRLHEVPAPDVPEITNSIRVGCASSFESTEKDLPSDYKEFDIQLTNEINSSEGDNQENDEWSVRTRTVARYLCRNFVYKNERRKDEVVSLLQVVNGKTKSESARLFYEILVLKTRGYIDVNQQASFDDILVLETPKLKQFCEVDELIAS